MPATLKMARVVKMLDRLRQRVLDEGARVIISNFNKSQKSIQTTPRTVCEVDFIVSAYPINAYSNMFSYIAQLHALAVN